MFGIHEPIVTRSSTRPTRAAMAERDAGVKLLNAKPDAIPKVSKRTLSRDRARVGDRRSKNGKPDWPFHHWRGELQVVRGQFLENSRSCGGKILWNFHDVAIRAGAGSGRRQFQVKVTIISLARCATSRLRR